MQECDWVACLRPPSPPESTNLVLLDWQGEVLPFGGEARFKDFKISSYP